MFGTFFKQVIDGTRGIASTLSAFLRAAVTVQRHYLYKLGQMKESTSDFEENDARLVKDFKALKDCLEVLYDEVLIVVAENGNTHSLTLIVRKLQSTAKDLRAISAKENNRAWRAFEASGNALNFAIESLGIVLDFDIAGSSECNESKECSRHAKVTLVLPTIPKIHIPVTGLPASEDDLTPY